MYWKYKFKFLVQLKFADCSMKNKSLPTGRQVTPVLFG